MSITVNLNWATNSPEHTKSCISTGIAELKLWHKIVSNIRQAFKHSLNGVR